MFFRGKNFFYKKSFSPEPPFQKNFNEKTFATTSAARTCERFFNADKWRKVWEDMVNAESERLGFDFRIDRRSYAEQGIEKIPTVHMGAAASQMEQRGIRTERGDQNREIEITNREIRQLRVRIIKLDKWIAD
ncbi:MAG: MobA/MobL family protein, partial [Defluviitaleaceae bacterium]|nr:MobA/MobL family protein [Defluviitaleaceae bacterium]